jgi:dienelactone hydrolase
MESTSPSSSISSVWVDHIPVIWVEPVVRHPTRQLVLFLHGLSGSKEDTTSFLHDIAAAGFIALSFDPWQHGERGTELPEQLLTRVFGDFQRHMWPILGQTTLDTLKVIDWAVDTLGVEPRVAMGGISMGGDIAIAAAGIDHRIERVAAVVATPDWRRPGMHDLFNASILLPPGKPDAYAQYFFDHLNPLTHLSTYAHSPAMNFVCGEKDTHVPPDGALRFQEALQEAYPTIANRVEVNLISGMEHLGALDSTLWWPTVLAWLTHT